MKCELTKNLGRPRGFDLNKVLRAAQEVFWRKGYESTSLVDITKATGLHKGSLYKAFGDKKGLYLLALETYMNERFEEIVDISKQNTSSVDSLKMILQHMVDSTLNNKSEAVGCMVVNTMIQLSDSEDDTKQLIEKCYEQKFAFFSSLIQKGQKSGEITNDTSAELLTTMIFTFIAGLSATIKMASPIAPSTLVNEFISSLTE